MGIPLDSDWNELPRQLEDEMTDAGKADVVESSNRPREARGGTFAPADITLIKNALSWYYHNAQGLTDNDERHVANLLHRLNRIV